MKARFGYIKTSGKSLHKPLNFETHSPQAKREFLFKYDERIFDGVQILFKRDRRSKFYQIAFAFQKMPNDMTNFTQNQNRVIKN